MKEYKAWIKVTDRVGAVTREIGPFMTKGSNLGVAAKRAVSGLSTSMLTKGDMRTAGPCDIELGFGESAVLTLTRIGGRR